MRPYSYFCSSCLHWAVRVFQVCSMAVSCRKAPVQQQQVCIRSARPLVPPLPAGLQSPIPRPKDALLGLKHLVARSSLLVPEGPAQLLPGSTWSQGRGGERKGGEAFPAGSTGRGSPSHNTLSIIAHPHPARPGAPPAGHCTHVLSAIRRQRYLGGATRSSGPQYTSVPCPAPRTAAAHADISAARHGSTAHPHDRLLHAALTILCARQACAEPPGQHRPVRSFVEAERNRDVNNKRDFSLSDALFALMGAGTAPPALREDGLLGKG